jgi:CheY-like chemotaxis protein/HPt (histidine-containing phosphotransfer) domain-containing protein
MTTQPSIVATLAVGEGAALAQRYPLSILVADDVEVNRKLALLMLRALGYEAHAVANGREALEAARRTEYDVVLMDVQMPEMDGFTAARAIADALGDTRPRFVGVTAYALASDRDNCLAAGLDEHLAKPFTLATLTEVILRVARALQERGEANDANPFGLPPATGEAPVPDDPIDRTRLESLRPYDADGSLVREATGAFGRDGPRYLAAMYAALSASSGADLASAAHALKGAAGNVGARALAAACGAVETFARTEELPRARAAVSRCDRDLDIAVRALAK